MMYIECIKEDGVWKPQFLMENSWEEAIVGIGHYVAFAIPGLTYAAEYARQAGMGSDDYKGMFLNVNQMNEAGTLYPAASVTFIPYYEANYYMGTVVHRESITDTDLQNYFNDVALANSQYIKSRTIIIDIRDLNLRDCPKLISSGLYEKIINTAKETFIKCKELTKIIFLENQDIDRN